MCVCVYIYMNLCLVFAFDCIFFFLSCDLQAKSELYTVGDFMTKGEHLHVVKPTTTVDEGVFHAQLLC